MTDKAPMLSQSRWAQLKGWFAAFAEAVETDSLGHVDARIAQLEERVAILERPTSPSLTVARH